MTAPTPAEEAGVRELLWAWDRIGLVGPEPWPRDEYDCMIAPLWSLVVAGASETEISRWVGRHTSEHFGLDPRPDADARLAAGLRQLAV